jgi:mannan endo-1,4-beta-mannosidase
VKTIVNRYKNSPNVFAWELINEARCSGDLGSSPACSAKSGTLHNWYKQQSAFIKSLDPYHMVSTGGEGQFYISDPTKTCLSQLCVNDYSFNGGAGEDFVADLDIDDIDFAVYHLYPQYWEAPLDTPGSNVTLSQWGAYWISEHAKAAKAANKPLVLEEFGYTGLENKTEVYPLWVGTALATGHAGIMPWQWGQLGLKESGGNRLLKYADVLSGGASPDDGFAIYENMTDVFDIFTCVFVVFICPLVSFAVLTR